MKDMLKSLRLAFLQTCGVLALAAFCALGALLSGCSVKKIEYEKNDKGEISYRIYENDHWLKTESTGIKGGMTGDGQFLFEAEGMKSSPSEEFNRTMQTYTTAFVQLAQIAAAAYNPSSSSAVKSQGSGSTPVSVNVTAAPASTNAASTNAVSGQAASAAATTNAADCVDCTPAK